MSQPPHISSDRIGLIGDVHGSGSFLLGAVDQLVTEHGVRELHQLGDFGIVGQGQQTRFVLDELERVLERLDARLFVTGGNHERYEDLPSEVRAGRLDLGEIGWLRDRIGWLPRGYRWRSESGRVLASLGGANSIDRFWREQVGLQWSPLEQITEADLEKLGVEPVDVLLAHDAPKTWALYNHLERTRGSWTPAGLAWAAEGQRTFYRGMRQVRPKLTISGHYHFQLDATETHEDFDGNEFESRSIILNFEEEPGSLGVLNLETLDAEVIDFHS
jgi:hypothetical protein